MNLEEISCKKCGASLSSSALASNRNIVECGHCSTVFTLDKELTGKLEDAESKLIIPMPKGITVTENGTFTIVYKWFSVKYIIILVFAVFWDIFMFVWFGISISQGIPAMALAGTLHALVGISLTYWGIAGIRNSTTITISDSIDIKHGPLKWPGNKILKKEEIIQLYCKQKAHKNKNGTTYSYEVHAIDKSQRSLKILGMLDEPELAFFIEKKIENHLNIADLAVPNEYKA